MQKSFIMLGLFVGSFIGGYIPYFFGVSLFSMIPIITSTLGGILGIYLSYKFTQNYM